MSNAGNATTNLGREIRNRLAQLAMSQRELARRINISRQTVQNVLHGTYDQFTEQTFAALDEGLRWTPGTARAFHEGTELPKGEHLTIEQQINAYLVSILERLGEMDLDQLEREVLILEDESRGIEPPDSHATRLIRKQIAHLVDSIRGPIENDDGGSSIHRAGPNASG